MPEETQQSTRVAIVAEDDPVVPAAPRPNAARANARSSRSRAKTSIERTRDTVSLVIAVAILVLGLYVAWNPTLVYASTPRLVLFFLIAMLPSILFTSSVVATITADLKWLGFSATGPAAVLFIGLFFLDKYAKPEERLAVYNLFEDQTTQVFADGVSVTGGARAYLDQSGHALIVHYGSSDESIQINIDSPVGRHFCHLSYPGTRSLVLFLREEKKECELSLSPDT